MTLPISALVLTLNNEASISRCLSSLCWASEIVVIDGGSSDDTQKICADPLAPWVSQIRFVRHPWEGFRVQRNFSLREARHDWVFIADSDEQCSATLEARLRELFKPSSGPPLRTYKVRRQEYFLGRPVNYGIWNPSYQDRLFHRQGVEYINDVHEYPRFSTEAGRIHEPLLHWPDFSPEKFLDKMNKYTSIEARDRVAGGMRTNPFRMLMAFPAMFWKNYFYYGAWRDGPHGFAISLLEGLSRAVRHIKMWQYGREADRP